MAFKTTWIGRKTLAHRLTLISACIACLGLAGVAHAQSTPNSEKKPVSHIERIKATGTIIMGYRETSVPFSYLDTSGPVGYSVDVSQAVAEHVRRKLGLPKLNIKWTPITLSTRISMVKSDAIDLECTTTSRTAEREKTLGFSNPYYMFTEGMMVRRSGDIKGPGDLAGKRVSIARGTPGLQRLSQLPNVQMHLEETQRLAMYHLVHGEADAYVASNAIIAGQLVRLDNASDFALIDTGGLVEPCACMMPKGDQLLIDTVNDAIAEMLQKGELEKLYTKWFMSPIPPLGRSLNLPPNQANQALFRSAKPL